MSNQWVIPDIHGCFFTLKKLMETHIQPSQKDELYFLGDLIDRGKRSKEVLDYLMDLEKQGFNIKAIKGNHEVYFLNAYDKEKNKKTSFFSKKHSKDYLFWLNVGGKETLKSFNTEDIRDIPESYIQWINQLPYYYTTDNYIMVHAGLNFNIENPFKDTDFMLTNTRFTVKPEKIGHKIIVHGHTPLSMEGIKTLINERNNYHYICLDNGCYYNNSETYGSLIALNLNTLEIFTHPNIDNRYEN